MTQLKKWISILLCACMMLGMAAIAEEAATPEATDAAVAADTTADASEDLADDTLLATVNGDEVKWGEVKGTYENLAANYGSYYDMADPANVSLFRAVALENHITEVLLMQEAVKNGLDQLTEEEAKALAETAEADWQGAMNNYLEYYYPDMTEETPEEERAAALKEAEAYYHELGFSPETLKEDYIRYEIFDRERGLLVQDVTVTDEDVEAEYQEKVAADKALYENDLSAYIEYNSYVDQMAMYAMMYGTGNEMDYAWYKPAGFRAVKHILLPVDEELMNKYTELQARLEEQENAEAAEEEPATVEEAVAAATAAENADPNATPEPTAEPVTLADVDQAKADVLASLADVIDEINQKVANGEDFDTLIAEYAVDAEGNPTDGGMVNEPTKTNGYEVAAESQNYVPEFVKASFSVDSIGDVSAPYLSDYGVHIVKYIGDVEPGPVEMTAEQREARRASLLTEKQNEVFNAQVEQWLQTADIVYTGVVPSVQQMENAQAAEAEEHEEMVAEGLETEEEPTGDEVPQAEEEPSGEDTAE